MLKRRTPFLFLSFLDAKFAERKAFESLAIQIKNLNPVRDQGRKSWIQNSRQKNLLAHKKKLGEENRELNKEIRENISQSEERKEKKTGGKDGQQIPAQGN